MRKEKRTSKLQLYVGAGLGGRLDHTSELKVMKFKEAMNGPGSNKWKAQIKNEHKKW